MTAKWLSEGNNKGELISDEEYKVEKADIITKIKNLDEQVVDNSSQGMNWYSACEDFSGSFVCWVANIKKPLIWTSELF